MAITKIYGKGNYFVVDITGSVKPLQDSKSNVIVSESKTEADTWNIESDKLGLLEIEFTDIQDEAGASYSLGAWETFYRENSGNFNLAPGSGALLPTNYITINSESELINVGGKNLLENNVYLFSNFGLFTRPFDFSNINSQCFLIFRGIFLYTGTGPFFQGNPTGSINIQDAGIGNDGSQPLFDITGAGIGAPSNAFIVRNSGFLGFLSTGIIKDIAGGTFINGVTFRNMGSGLVLKDNQFIDLEISFRNAVSNNSPQLVLDNIVDSGVINSKGLTMNAGESYLQISKNISVDEIIVSNIPYDNSTGAEFLASAVIGAITVFADNGSGGTTVTSVSNGLTIEQEVTISATTNYNGDFNISNVTANTFDIDTAFIANDATGSFTTNDTNDFLDSNNFEFKGNGDQIDSNEITKYKSVNSILVTIVDPSTDGTNAVDVIGNAIDWSEIIERRFKVQFLGDPNGTVRYTGAKGIAFRISARVTADVVGGSAKDINAYITVNGDVQVDSKFSVNASRAVTLNPEDLLMLSPGDYVGVAVENGSDSTNIDVLFVNMNIIKA